MSEAASRLPGLREGLFEELLLALRAAGGVLGVSFVGSLGKGIDDEWSDLDLLIVVDDDELGRLANPQTQGPWAGADLLIDARHNSPAGALAVGTTYLREGLPFWVDWYLFPRSLARWPTDSRLIYETAPIHRTAATFDEMNSADPRQPATPKTGEEVRIAHLSMVPIAGKYIARRSPQAEPMIRFLGGPDGPDAAPNNQLVRLTQAARRLAHPEDRWLADPIDAYLALVRGSLQ